MTDMSDLTRDKAQRWRRTADEWPTEADADEYGFVWAGDPRRGPMTKVKVERVGWFPFWVPRSKRTPPQQEDR